MNSTSFLSAAAVVGIVGSVAIDVCTRVPAMSARMADTPERGDTTADGVRTRIFVLAQEITAAGQTVAETQVRCRLVGGSAEQLSDDLLRAYSEYGLAAIENPTADRLENLETAYAPLRPRYGKFIARYGAAC